MSTDESEQQSAVDGGALSWWGQAVLIVLAVGVLLWAMWAPGETDSPQKVIITQGKMPEAAVKKEASASPPRPAPGSCKVPPLDESVRGKDIEYKQGVSTLAVGGSIEPGRYRLKGAYSADPKFGAGRWSMLLDFGEGGHGAYYRKLGFRAMMSLMRWTSEGTQISLEMLCPDPGQRLQFSYSIREGELFLIAKDDVVLPLERYADSKVTPSSKK